MSERPKRLEGWGSEDRERSWWKRGYDPIGRHTMVAAVLGVLMAALIGATLDPLNLRTSDDLKRAEQAAYDEAYASVEARGYADGLPYGEVQHLGTRIVDEGAGAASPYAEQFRTGWTQGWNEALAALRSTAEDEGLPSDYTEFRVLDQLAPR